MRKLTIFRRKSFVASLAVMKVYIEDHENKELEIHGIPCRKLGKLKNGEKAEFEIDNNGGRVFVIADKTSKEYCSDYVIIQPGENDLYFEGQNKYNMGNGNAFRFDGVTNPEVLAARKKGNSHGLVITIIAAVVGVIIGFLLYGYLGA